MMTKVKLKSATLTFLFATTMAIVAKADESSQKPPKLSEKSKRFVKRSGLAPGPYEKIEGPEDCLEGLLYFNEVDDVWVVIVGSHPLVSVPFSGKLFYKNNRCEVTESARVKKHLVVQKKVLNCGKEKFVYKTEVKYQPKSKSIEYNKKIHVGEKTPKEITCRLKKSKQ